MRFRFTINDTTPFSDGAREILDAAGVGSIVPWADVTDLHYDLVLSASENVDFDALSGHTIVLPHGLGFNKYVPTPDGATFRLAGLPPDGVLADGRATIVLSHPEQEVQLRAVCPTSAGHTAVTGDVMFDRLRASTPFRERYRTVLGTADRVLVVVTSTWRPSSALGRERSLLGRLLAELPIDRYQVCAVLHPNIWAWYGRAQVRLWLAAELDAGLVLLPPEHGWQSALIAADQVLTDHGSLGLFAAALGRPLVLVGDPGPTEEIVPDTPITELTERAPRLDLGLGLREQLDESRQTHHPDDFVSTTNRVFAHVGDSATRLRDLVYHRLSLVDPDGPAILLRIPDPPRQPTTPVASYAVCTTAVAHGELDLVRYPAATWRGQSGTNTHIVCDEAEPDLRLRERAAVLTSTTIHPRSDAIRWATTALEHHPGARLAAARVANGCVVSIRGGKQVTVLTKTVDSDVMVAASAVYCWLLSGDLVDQDLRVTAGTTVVPMTILTSRPDPSAVA